MVFVQAGVLIGAFPSKTTVAVFWTTVPVITVDFGTTVKKTLPSAPGGRKPAVGSVGGWFVVGSRDWNVSVSVAVEVLREAVTLTRRFAVGRRSTVVVNGETDNGIEGGLTT